MPATIERTHAFDEARKAGREPFKVKDLSLAEFGRPCARGTSGYPRGIPVFGWKGGNLHEYWGCNAEARRWPDNSGSTQIVDDGGDATLFVHKALEFETAGKIPAFNPASDPEEWGVILNTLSRELKEHPGVWTKIANGIKGVSEETTT